MAESSSKLLTDVLKSVSRSFYLSLRLLPASLRTPMSLGYLIARAADTIADTEIVPRDRRIDFLRDLLTQLCQPVPSSTPLETIKQVLSPHQELPDERRLLECLPEAVSQYARTREDDRLRLKLVLSGLIRGMAKDLHDFPGNSPEEMRSFQSLHDLDAYTHHAAGIVGEFWTDMSCAHLRSLRRCRADEMKSLGISFGKGLQLVNVLKDAPRDLRNGRCYFPAVLLNMVSLSPQDLLEPRHLRQFRPVLSHLVQTTLDHLDAARDYVLMIPRREIRLRLACILPLWIGLRTLALLTESGRFLDPGESIKVSRPEVHRLARLAVASVSFNALVKGYTVTFRTEVEELLLAVGE